jgi:hypothetical protein
MSAGTDGEKRKAEFAEHQARALRNPATLAFLAAQRVREAEVRAKAEQIQDGKCATLEREPEIRAQTGRTDSLLLTVAWFDTAKPDGPAYGDPETTCWGEFASMFEWRREGEKDGPNVVPSRFRLEPNGRQVRRKLDRVLARTAVALDIETNAKTGEVPPFPTVAASRLEALQLAGIVYTSHSHHPETNVRYRIILPLEKEVPPELPAPQIVGERLCLVGVLDRSKFNGAAADQQLGITHVDPAGDLLGQKTLKASPSSIPQNAS